MEEEEAFYAISIFFSTVPDIRFGPYKFDYYLEDIHIKGVGFLFWYIGINIKKEGYY